MTDIIKKFLNDSRVKIAQLSSVITEQQRDGDQAIFDNVRLRKELIVFNRTLNNAYLDWTRSDILKAIHYYNVKANLNSVPYIELSNTEAFVVDGGYQPTPSGNYATKLELQIETLERENEDNNLQEQINNLEDLINNIDLSSILPAGFLDDVAYKDELHSHSNKGLLDNITQSHIDIPGLFTAHNNNNERHITSTERNRWDSKVGNTDPRLSDARPPLPHTHDPAEIDGLPDLINAIYQEIENNLAKDGEDGKTPVLSIGDVEEGEEYGASITGDIEDLKLNITFKPGQPGRDFRIDELGPAANRFSVDYEDIHIYLATDENNIYIRIKENPVTDTDGWSAPIPFGYKGWSPIIGVYQPRANRAVLELIGWVGGTGSPPEIPVPGGMDPETARIFIGPNGYTFFENQAVNLIPTNSGEGLSVEDVGLIVQSALEFYVLKEEGKGLSSNDFTSSLKGKVEKIVDSGNGDKFLADDGSYKKPGSNIINDNSISLDRTYSSSKITQLFDALASGLIPKGNWEADSGTAPHPSPEHGWFWIVVKAGSTELGEEDSWDIGDYIWWNGTTWLKVPAYEKGLVADKEVDTSNRGDGRVLIFDATIDKHRYVDFSSDGYKTAEELRIALGTLEGDDRLDASAIKNIPAANLSEEITVNLGPGESVGGYSTGDVVLINTDFTTVMKKLLMKAQPVSYLAPTSALSKSPTTNYYELGSLLNITLTPTFNARDSGGIDTHVLKKNGVEVHTDFSAYLDSFVANTLGVITYSSTITYLQGACKLNNLGDQDCTGRIEAGSLTKSQTTNIILPWFYGVSDTDDVADIYDTGTKVVSNVTAELTVNSFGSGIKFMWFAVPKGSKTFTSWYRTELNQGSIGNPGDLFKAKVTKLVSSSGLAQDYEDEEYDFYITSSATDASVTTKLS